MEFSQTRTRRRDLCESIDVDEQEDPPSSSSISAAASNLTPPSSSQPAAVVQKEHMFDKIVTPSDVGKLNRLVIPKQHAEKYFPLDTTVNEKGLLLNFEDRIGKAWRFRYSYWNSSQSYVMTKGWSRFVKEKRLDAGDTISFGRAVDDQNRLFIDWKRRPDINHGHDAAHRHHQMPRIPLPMPPMGFNYNYQNYHQSYQQYHQYRNPMLSFSRSTVGPWPGRLLLPPPTATAQHSRQDYEYNNINNNVAGAAQYLVFRSAGATMPPPVAAMQSSSDGGVFGAPMVLDSVPVMQSQAAAKRVRLFGVNLDCPEIVADGVGDISSSSSTVRLAASKGKEKEEGPSLDLDM